MNPTNVYWSEPRWVRKNTFLKADPSSGLGVWVTLPWPDPVSSGHYYGEGAAPDRRQLSFETQPEMFAVDNVITSSGGQPRLDPNADFMKLSREKKIIPY